MSSFFTSKKIDCFALARYSAMKIKADFGCGMITGKRRQESFAKWCERIAKMEWYDYFSPVFFGLLFPILPLYLPLLLVSAHPYTIMIWMVLININTVIVSHGGIKRLSEFHDNHHKYFNVNFGMNMVMDYLFDYR